jgi:hypothetical protein
MMVPMPMPVMMIVAMGMPVMVMIMMMVMVMAVGRSMMAVGIVAVGHVWPPSGEAKTSAQRPAASICYLITNINGHEE